MTKITKNDLAYFGGPKAIPERDDSLFHWPIVTEEDIAAVRDVLVAGIMSGTGITKEFEKEFAQWNGAKYALGCCNGTASLTAAMWACGVGAGDEVICPSLTYWATCASALQLGATVNFADADPVSLCIDPNDIEHRISERTKAIVVVHYCGTPVDMDAIMDIARRHGIKVLEDVSHAVGSLYKGRKCGTLGDIAGMSMMAGKAFAIGEAGMVLTNNRELYERCIAFGHYERTGAPSRFNPPDAQITMDSLLPYIGLPLGGVKHRMNQTCAAMGRVQLKYYQERIEEIDRAMTWFMDRIEAEIPGLTGHRPTTPGSTNGGWYVPCCHYDPAAFGGCPAELFSDLIRAEGMHCVNGINNPLHLHPYFHTADIFHQGCPTALAFGQRDVRQGEGACPVTEAVTDRTIQVPWFKHCRKEEIEKHVAGFVKVATFVRENPGFNAVK
ncbi:MAG: DegT/DnrJ/EryC1/StrS family aminotransferase [Planctomycetia bacterium]|nr:DegT/DnrJ/EryC1/StrS family aminotransferase [Planctomycetia bacterium]